ncbi:uncharacterized protein LACBIDRAFT_253196 [Laccaria bicolor S238N-H82]|uniref:Predicted protein n=1 Tax=Laccaria bicolor (strain S238N-H82 / ATCC MYA-4686) TaxID=486041 RepID=B0DP42_LACBS|nr:uncharacterized protein LACBIDRAFT_253196 [Laccaria bicolor S238N-H82]EDR03548.1 predicted protein [Laccaria bicolor S238N-H82]|eukprot:XP_001885696.1 predicted protein [Laccaria bicolor S238N-H82]
MPPLPPFIPPYLNLAFSKDHISSLPQLITFAAEHNPHHTFALQLCTSDSSRCELSFVQLRGMVERASAWLVSSGTTTGRRRRDEKVGCVAILLASDVGLFVYLSALLRIGVPALLLSARLSPTSIAHLIKETSPTSILISSQTSLVARKALSLLPSSYHFPPPRLVTAHLYSTFLLPGSPTPDSPRSPAPPSYEDHLPTDLDALILHSSGTTGLPKAIYHSHAFLLLFASAHRFEEKMGEGYSVVTSPLYHGFGLLAPLLSLSINLPFVLPPSGVIPTALSTLHTIHSTNARYLFTVPCIIEDILCLPDDVGLEAMKKLDIVVVGGAPLKDIFGGRMAEGGVNVLNHWGASETGPITPIETVKPGYHDWRYLSPRTDMGFKFIPEGHNPNEQRRTYTLVFRPPGWKEDFVLKDLLWAAPEYQILTRTDTLIVLSNGEKFNPEFAERLIGEHPDVRGVLAFGQGEVAVGVVIELRTEVGAGESEQGIFTYIDRANLLLDAHAQISSELVVCTFGECKPLVRTDKGSVARKANYALFEREIRGAYERMGSLGSVAGPNTAHEFPMSSSALCERLHQIVEDITGISLPQNDSDMFEAGLDSLQASRVQRAILDQLRNSRAASFGEPQLEKDFCFAYPSVDKMTAALLSLIRGMKEMNGAGAGAASPPPPPPQDSHSSVVLLTGSTGSLGCFLLARLAKDPGVSKVICLNRACSPGLSLHQRQTEALERRGACVSREDWAKVGELGEVRSFFFPFVRLIKNSAQLKSVTHIIHNAWPVNFNLHLSSFEPHVKGLCHLIRLALLNAGTIRIMFTSSIAVASRYSLPSSSTFPSSSSSSEIPAVQVPEIPLDATHPAPFGYAQAKWVCEQLLESVNQLFGSRVRASAVRLGQITGTMDKGAWNEWEHVPLMTASWLPVDRASEILIDLLFSPSFKPIYHLENPIRRPWPHITHTLASLLSGTATPLPLLPFQQWIACVRDSEEVLTSTPIMRFLEEEFGRLGVGLVGFCMDGTGRDSAAFRELVGGNEEESARASVAYWRRVGVMV